MMAKSGTDVISKIVFIFGWLKFCIAVPELATILASQQRNKADWMTIDREKPILEERSVSKQINSWLQRHENQAIDTDFGDYLTGDDAPWQSENTNTDIQRFNDKFRGMDMDTSRRLLPYNLIDIVVKRSDNSKPALSRSKRSINISHVYNRYLLHLAKFFKIRRHRKKHQPSAPKRRYSPNTYRRFDTFDSLGSGLIGK